MVTRRIEVLFSQALDAETVDDFEVIIGIFGHTYRTNRPHAVVILADPSRATDLELQLAEWKKEGAVMSWSHAT